MKGKLRLYNLEMDNKSWDKEAGHPMQGWEWGEFRTKMGNKVSRLVGEKQYQIMWSKLYFLPWWFGYIPMGQIPTKKDIELLKNETKRHGAIGIRMEPNVIKNTKVDIPHQLIEGRHLFKPKTYWIDLTNSEEELLGAMHPKCKYNIRLAQKHGVTISKEADIDKYLELMFGKTTKRQKIYAHTKRYHRELAKQNFAHLFKAELNGKTIATWMIFVWKDFVYYAYGAFDDDFKDKMAPVLGLWEIIKWTKGKGFKTLDLWGAEEGKGFSRFKEQFGPQMVEMVGTYDLPVNRPLYYLFRIAEEMRWKMLRKLK